MFLKKIIFGILLHVVMQIFRKYCWLFSDFTCDEIMEATKIVKTKSASTNFYILLAFLLVFIALLITVSIYCYLIKHQAKQKILIIYHKQKHKKILTI